MQNCPAAAKQRLRAQQQISQDMDRLWSPFGRELMIAGISLGNSMARDSAGMLNLLAQHWAPVFDIKPFDLKRAEIFLADYQPAFNFAEARPPSQHHFVVSCNGCRIQHRAEMAYRIPRGVLVVPWVMRLCLRCTCG